MKVELWAEIHRLKKVDNLSTREICERLRCCHKTVKKALNMQEPSDSKREKKSIIDPYKDEIAKILERYPNLSSIRVHEKLQEKGFDGSVFVVRKYVRQIRPVRQKRVYLESNYDPGEAMQIDYGTCGKVRVGEAFRKVYVFVAVLCYSRMIYIEFCLSQRKEEFYTSIVNALRFFCGVPRKIIIDNLKAAVVDGHGANARFHPDFQALCGHYLMKPVACARRDPETKGRVEDGVKYVKINALAGYDDRLTSFVDYQRHAVYWRDKVANVRIHGTTREKPIVLFEQEKLQLRDLGPLEFNTDIVLPIKANSMARIHFDANRYSVPPAFARRSLTLRANREEVKLFCGCDEVATHRRCYEKHQLILLEEHRLQALALRRRREAEQIQAEFDGLCAEARNFRRRLVDLPVKAQSQMRKILKLAALYGRSEVATAIAQSLQFGAVDAAYIENLIEQRRRRRNLPSPLPLCPARKELLEEVRFESSDLSEYDKIFGLREENDE